MRKPPQLDRPRTTDRKGYFLALYFSGPWVSNNIYGDNKWNVVNISHYPATLFLPPFCAVQEDKKVNH